MLMVSTSELFVVVSADTADLVCFPLFFASAAWAAAWEVGIFPVVCSVRHGAATLDGPL
jgi:peroxiredoxin family protein